MAVEAASEDSVHSGGIHDDAGVKAEVEKELEDEIPFAC